MKIASILHDGRIKADNYLVEISIGDYVDIARLIIENNEFQRKRVSNSKTVYSLLKTDAALGCVIPPIVLALSYDVDFELNEGNMRGVLSDNIAHLMILDGLQRTHSLIDIEDQMKAAGDAAGLINYRNLMIRCEIYIGLNRLGILYRMLTLNTGQTPMSLRQQIEILYLDYLKEGVDGITLARETDSTRAKGLSSYNFKEVIEGFNCYLERNELPIERADLLENIRSMEKLSQENSQSDLFKDFIVTFNAFVLKISTLFEGVQQDSIDYENVSVDSWWGKTGVQIFKKQQSLAGFGAAVGKLKDNKIVDGFSVVTELIDNIYVDDPVQFIIDMNKSIDFVAKNSKKIGNAQRMFFQYYFRELFNKSSDGYLSLDASIELAVQKYKSQVL